MNSGIYKIEAPSGGFYIGSAVDFGRRWCQHRHELRKGNHFNLGLRRAAAKYGIDKLVFSKLIVCRVQDLIMFEQIAIDGLKPKYNACRVAGSKLGVKHSEEAKRKFSVYRTGRSVHSPESRAKMRSRMMGNKFGVGVKKSNETRAKISSANAGKLHQDSLLATMTDEFRDSLTKSYEAGIGLVALARSNGVDHRTMKKALVSAGVVLRKCGWKNTKPQIRAPILAENVRLEIASHHQSGKSLRAMSEHFGMNREAIKRAIKASGLEIRSRSQAATLRYNPRNFGCEPSA